MSRSSEGEVIHFEGYMGNLGNLGKLSPNALISLELSSSIILIYEPVNLLSRMGSINYFTPVVQKILYTYFRNYLRNNIPTWKPDWMRYTTRHTQPKEVVSHANFHYDYLHAKNPENDWFFPEMIKESCNQIGQESQLATPTRKR